MADQTFPIDDTMQDLLDQAQQIADDKFPLDSENPLDNDVDIHPSEGGQEGSNNTIESLQQQIKQLELKLSDAEQITKKAQSDYIHMKFDFDSYMRRNEEQSKTAKVDTLVDVVRKFTPFIDSLRVSLANIPTEHNEDALVQWVQMVYKKFISMLEMMGIQTIESIGQEPNHELHEAVSAMITDDANLKGKIIQEFEQGFMYNKGDVRKVVTTAKVVVGQ